MKAYVELYDDVADRLIDTTDAWELAVRRLPIWRQLLVLVGEWMVQVGWEGK